MIFWFKNSVLSILLSLSVEVKNFFLVVRIACLNLFWTALHAVQSEIFWVRCARYRLRLRSDISCSISRLFNQGAWGLVHFIRFRGACRSIHSATRLLKVSNLSSGYSIAYTLLNGNFWKSAINLQVQLTIVTDIFESGLILFHSYFDSNIRAIMVTNFTARKYIKKEGSHLRKIIWTKKSYFFNHSKFDFVSKFGW